ncbi:MAG: DUF1796 family putative cysteine peptidase [Candidatus Gastranaerophilales bacterium]|nr:DUF1796 family putative cysteine peptidase [Candidatus Gastranaerophilales bacterium]
MTLDLDFNIECDCVISIGPTCRTAEALVRNKLRMFSSPFDWIGFYSLDSFFNLLITDGKNLFKDIIRSPKDDREHTYGIIDVPTNTLSMHDFFKNIPFEVAKKEVSKKMHKRFKRLNRIMKQTKKMCFVSNRDEDKEHFFELAKKLTEVYNFSDIYFINILNREEEQFNVYKKDNVELYEISFSDPEFVSDDLINNPDSWKGNIKCWDNVLKHVKLTNRINYNKYFVLNFGLFKITCKRNL